MCSGSTDFYLAGLAALGDDVAAAERHYRMAAAATGGSAPGPCSRTPCANTRCCCRQRAAPGDLPVASAALAEARAIAADCGMTRLLAALDRPDQPDEPGSALTLTREDDFWLVGYADSPHSGAGQPGPAVPGPARP